MWKWRNHTSIKFYKQLVGMFQIWLLFSISYMAYYGMSSFPLTHIFQRGWNHQPDNVTDRFAARRDYQRCSISKWIPTLYEVAWPHQPKRVTRFWRLHVESWGLMSLMYNRISSFSWSVLYMSHRWEYMRIRFCYVFGLWWSAGYTIYRYCRRL